MLIVDIMIPLLKKNLGVLFLQINLKLTKKQFLYLGINQGNFPLNKFLSIMLLKEDYFYETYINNLKHGFMQPGQNEGHNYYNTDNYLTKNVLLEMVELDAKNYNFTFEPIGKSEQYETVAYKVALVIAPGIDYHWYRQNSDGTWSHKPGQQYSRCFDASNTVIYDPETCDRNYSYTNYAQFCGFFEVNVSQMI